ncbi:MAG: HPr family phosphocarrier protein [Peptococcaceae bacterium]|nr:HPr family phosphocarrier protein [Peptococcaceae bacterium]
MREVRVKVQIVNAVLHFRPFARLRELAGKLDVELLLGYKGEVLPITRLLALIGWELTRGAEIEVVVRSSVDPSSALETIVAFIQDGLGEAQTNINHE